MTMAKDNDTLFDHKQPLGQMLAYNSFNKSGMDGETDGWTY